MRPEQQTRESHVGKPVPILLYHSISNSVSSKFTNWVVSPESFESHMEYLHVNGYTSITVGRLVDAIENPETVLPDRAVVLTFDDGYTDFYLNALPSLKQYGFTATSYITTDYVGGVSKWLENDGEGNRRIMSWEQVSEVSAAGIECGAHSGSHPQLDTLSHAAIWDEISRSKNALEEHLSQQIDTFAYPHGYHNGFVRRAVIRAGFTSACGVKHAMSATYDDQFSLARIIIGSDTDSEKLGALLNGTGLRVAPKGERMRTKVWRLARRSAARWK